MSGYRPTKDDSNIVDFFAKDTDQSNDARTLKAILDDVIADNRGAPPEILEKLELARNRLDRGAQDENDS